MDLSDAGTTAAYGSTSSPDCVYIESNVNGTFNLLQAVRSHWEQLPTERQATFRFHHISTDEVFGSLGPTGRFSETTPYDPRSPYSASKAGGDPQGGGRRVHSLVWRWHQCARLALRGRPRGCPAAGRLPGHSRQGHDRRYAIDPTRISSELGWQPRHSFQEGLAATVAWYLEQQDWCRRVREQGGYSGGRLGALATHPSRAGMAVVPGKN